MKIITLSREFGSGGRELGKRLAERLNFAYYDKEIISAVAQQGNLDEGYVQRILESSAGSDFPVTFGRTFSMQYQQTTTKLLLMQKKIIKAMAEKSDCIIVGRSADSILQSFKPLNLFVYADMDARIKRCQDCADSQEPLTQKELQAKIQKVDQQRRRYYELCTGRPWGIKENYHLCINTTGSVIKDLVPAIADYAEIWLQRGEK